MRKVHSIPVHVHSKALTSATAYMQRRALVDQLVTALADPIERNGFEWWSYYHTLSAVGFASAGELLGEVERIEAEGGMQRQDGSRRTRGGVFFALAKKRLGRRAWRRLERQAMVSWAMTHVEAFFGRLLRDVARIDRLPMLPEKADKFPPRKRHKIKMPEVEVVTRRTSQGGA